MNESEEALDRSLKVTGSTKEELDLLKIVERETYDAVIKRLVKFYRANAKEELVQI